MTTKPKLLLIDDDKGVLNSNSLFLSKHFDVDTSETVENAISRLNSTEYRVALIDMAFPDDPEGGLKICQHIANTGLKTRAIIYTAYREVVGPERVNAYGYVDKGKPYSLEALLNNALAAAGIPQELIKEASENIFFNEAKAEALPCAIKQIQIEDYHGIIKTSVTGIPTDTQWIFLTGENGFGKTAILQAIAIGLFGKKDGQEILTESNCRIGVEFKNRGKNQINNIECFPFEKFSDFAAYGPSRFELQSKESQNQVDRKSAVTYSLFNTDGNLLNIEYELLKSHFRKKSRHEIIKNALIKILPYIANIQVNDNDEIVYIEKESGDSKETYKPLPFKNLASGHKNILAMIGDMLIRFYREQPDVSGPEDFCGIVLINELDAHLHPKWQRELLHLLSDTFPKIQFIASTHSVIPFLGAPENSVFLKVVRNKEEGIRIERLDIDIKNLLPNTILTSPLFDLEKITQRNIRDISEARTEDTYDQMKKNDEIGARLKAFEESDRDFPDDLFE